MVMTAEEFEVIKQRAKAERLKKDAEVKALMPEGLKHYNLSRNWHKFSPEAPVARQRLDRDLRIYAHHRALEAEDHYRKLGYKNYSSSIGYEVGTMPAELDSRCYAIKAGRPKGYADYILGGGCHWVCNWLLSCIEQVEPNKPWRIVTSDLHTCLWDGNRVLLDITYQGLDLSIEDSYWNTMCQPSYQCLEPGQELELY